MTGSTQIVFLGMLILAFFVAMLAFFWCSYILAKRPDSLSLYSRLPIRRCANLPFETKLNVLRYLYSHFEYDNRIFDINKAAFCRQTGRIFPNAVNWYGRVFIDWTFLQKRYPGNYVSWGSLTEEQQTIIRLSHESLEGFQTEFSSPTYQPSKIEAQYALSRPGPLYVDIESKILLGWKFVPDTELEVLIVQKPIKLILTSIT